jgi:hypothetical protein
MVSLRALGLTAAVVAAASCNSLDTTRVAAKKATLGDDIYGIFCDRVGASAIPEDLGGASYNAVCHYDDAGKYGDKVDQSVLPPPQTAAQQRARKLSVAKLERMAQRRGDLIRAINATFPDTAIADVTSKDPNAQIRLHDALMTFAQNLTPLYESNPFDKKGEPLLPSQTRALGRLFDSFGAPGTCAGGSTKCTWDSDCGDNGICQNPVRDAFQHIWARRGYRPFQVGLGAVRPALGYPDLRKLTTTTLSVLGPGGSASTELQQVLTVAREELRTAEASVSKLPAYSVDPNLTQPNRPRQNIEFVQALFLTQDDAFNSGGLAPMYIAQRDRRGFVVPAGNTPGVPGTVPAPFSDQGNDGYADTDGFGRFLDGKGMPLSLDAPFAIPGETMGSADSFGRPDTVSSKFTYLDTSRTLVGGLAKHLIPLVDPTILSPGDPNAWQQEHETLMYALAGAYTLFGNRVDATYDYGNEGPGGRKISYRAFKADESPIPDLIHAAGQVLADEDSDALLLSLLDLLQNHEQVVARLMGSALKIREIAKQHDQLAAQGSEKKAELAYEVPLWDEMGAIVDRILEHPGLLQALLAAMADDTAVTPIGNAKHMGDAMSRFVSFRDELTYDKFNINGPAVNITVSANGGATDDPKTPVDRTQPQTGKNMSCMQRSLALIHAADGGPACNKNGAKVTAKLGPFNVTMPLIGSYGECDLFQFNNLSTFYLDSLLPPDHPKRSQLVIKDATLSAMLSFLQTIGFSPDDLFQTSSGITGLTLHPTPSALNRLVFFGATTDNYPAMPDHDSVNQGGTTDNFVHGTIEPISVAACPPDGKGVPTCPDNPHTVRIHNANTIFLWERYGFSKYLGPMTQAFANVACAPDLSSCDLSNAEGERIFIDLFGLLDKHWPGPDHGPECSKTAPAKGDLCSEAGLNRYEPILSEAFVTDIVPAMHEFAKVAMEISKITVKRGPKAGQVWTGGQVLEKLTRILFSTKYAAQHGMVDRKGNASTTWVDGTPQPQLTAFTLFADALHKIDTTFASACDCSKKTGVDQAECMKDPAACQADVAARQGQWKRARSQLVDEFLAVDGDGTSAAFHNPTVTPTLVATLSLLREQLNANCPDRESGAPCTWAKKDLGDKLAGVMSRPLFAALVDMQDKIRKDDGARRQLETFLQYTLKAATDDGEALQGTLSSIADLLQVLQDDGTLTPILQAASSGLAPDDDPDGAGAAGITIKVLKALTDDTYDRYHVMDHVLPNLVTPMDDGKNLSPIEIFMDVIADVNRIDASQGSGPMASDDYQGVMTTMQAFMTDKTRGLEQLYTIIQKRPKQ